MGLDDTVVLAGGRHGLYYQHFISQDKILRPIPPAPVFTQPVEDIRRKLKAFPLGLPAPTSLEGSYPAAAMEGRRPNSL